MIIISFRPPPELEEKGLVYFGHHNRMSLFPYNNLAPTILPLTDLSRPGEENSEITEGEKVLIMNISVKTKSFRRGASARIGTLQGTLLPPVDLVY